MGYFFPLQKPQLVGGLGVKCEHSVFYGRVEHVSAGDCICRVCNCFELGSNWETIQSFARRDLSPGEVPTLLCLSSFLDALHCLHFLLIALLAASACEGNVNFVYAVHHCFNVILVFYLFSLLIITSDASIVDINLSILIQR